jgi:peptidyl-Asp metalloendopeptidase
VAVTEEVVEARGGKENCRLRAETAVTDVNRLFRNSNITCRIRLVAVAFTVKFKEPGGRTAYKDMLEALTANQVFVVVGKNGPMSIRQARNQSSANLVSLFTNSQMEAGLAHTMQKRETAFAAWAYSVVNQKVASGRGYHALAHELGHNFGCCHDRAHHNGKVVAPYAHGHSFNVDGSQYGTVMCASHQGRIEYFSNPDVKYKGQPTGISPKQPGEAHNAKVIDESAGTVITFR